MLRQARAARVVQESADLGVTALAWAPTSLAAVALARAGKENGFRPIAELLHALPLDAWSSRDSGYRGR